MPSAPPSNAAQVVFVRRARRQLNAQIAYVAERNPAAAQRLRERIAAAQRQLADFPRSAPRGALPGTRRLVVAPYVLTYRERGTVVEVIDIRHGRQAEHPIPEEG
jgi:plasmid stabilization system protein ParE